MNIKAGRFEVSVYGGGHPVNCHLLVDGEKVAIIQHQELSDLKHAIKQAMKQARNALPEDYKDEV